MKRLLLALGACAACTRGPLPAPTLATDAGSPATSSSGVSRVSQRAALLEEAKSTGLDVVFEGWLEPQTELGGAAADTCLRIRGAVGDAGSTTLTIVDHEGEHESTLDVPMHDAWISPHCVRRGTKVTLVAKAPTEVVVVASAAFR